MPSYTYDVYINSNGSNTWYNGDTLGKTTVIIDDIDNDGVFEYADTINGENPNGMWTQSTMYLTNTGLVTGMMIRTPNTMYFFPTDGTVPSDDTFVSANLTGSASNTSISSLCFAAGTAILTSDGERNVETLRIGDLVMTADGKAVPIKWIGRQTVHRLFSGQRIQPVRIRAGAFGVGLPHTDLTVTADHGMVIDGLVINASALINGTTIDWVPMAELGDTFTVYHIETENHDVILANGAPSETFIDYRDRAAFDNHQEYLDLYGAERIIPEMPYPRISTARLVPQNLKERLGLSDGHIDTPLRA